MGKVLSLATGGVAFLLAFVASLVFFSPGHPQTPQEAQAQLERDVAGIKKTLPQECGPSVTWFDAEARWHTIVYKYKVRIPREVIVANKKQLEAQLKSSMVLGAAKFMMPSNAKMICELYDDGGGYIYTLDLD